MKQYTICYPEGKHKALTFSYDDGKIEDRRLVNLFNKYGLKATFHLNGGLFPDLTTNENKVDQQRIPSEEIKELFEGHEVAAHTYTHPTIERCPIDKVALEIIEDRKMLESLVGYPVQGFSYPNGSYTKEIKSLLPSLGIEYGRIVGSTHKFDIPTDWYEWQSTCHHNQNLLKNGESFVSLNKQQYLYLMYVWGHSYEFERDQNWNLIEEFCEMVGKEKNIWFVTNIYFKRYMEAAKKLVVSVAGDTIYNPSIEPVWLSVDDSVIKVEPGLNIL